MREVVPCGQALCPCAPAEDIGAAVVDACEREASAVYERAAKVIEEGVIAPGPELDAIAAKMAPPGRRVAFAPELCASYGRPVPIFMSTDSNVRKSMPVATGCAAYFPDALLCVAFVSKVGNDKHNPGQPLHWAKEKSQDEPDAELRHMLDAFRKLPPDKGLEPLGDLGHLASKAWRALGDLQRGCDRVRAKYEAGR